MHDMNKTIKMGIYPFCKDAEALIVHSDMLIPGYQISALAAPRGWGYKGEKISLGKTGESLPVFDSLAEIVDQSDALFVPSFEGNAKIQELIVNQIISQLNRIKFVYCSMQFNNEIKQKLISRPEIQDGTCEYDDMSKLLSEKHFDGLLERDIPYDKLPLIGCDIPVVAVAGMLEGTGKFDTALAIREKFVSAGYRVSQIGSRNYCKLLGFHSFPDFMFNPRIDEVKKILLFNRYISKLAREENPDLFIINIPGAIKEYNEKFPNRFGLLAYMTFKAIKPDYFILCTTFGSFGREEFDRINQICEYLFNVRIDCFQFSNLLVQSKESTDKLGTLPIFPDIVKNTVKDMRKRMTEYSVIDIQEEKDREWLYRAIVSKLSGEVRTVCM